MSRRALLGGAAVLAAAGVSGCASGGRSAAERAPSSTTPSTSSGTATSAPAAGSDREIALEALADERLALSVYSGVARRHRDLRDVRRTLVAIQRRHVDTLAAALEQAAASHDAAVVAGSPALAVIAEAQRLQDNRFADCQQVEDGNLASMLASMYAAHKAIEIEWSNR